MTFLKVIGSYSPLSPYTHKTKNPPRGFRKKFSLQRGFAVGLAALDRTLPDKRSGLLKKGGLRAGTPALHYFCSIIFAPLFLLHYFCFIIFANKRRHTGSLLGIVMGSGV